MEDKLISVVVNCFNGDKYLEECLDSIKKQSYKNFEVIFFDNCSTDNSKFIFNKISDERFKYFSNDIHTNLSTARNNAIKKARGEIISILDVDDYWDKEMLNNVNIVFNENKEIMFSFTNFYILKNNKKIKVNSKVEEPLSDSIFKNYKLGINTISFNYKIFKNYKFNEKYHMIGDFDLIANLSLKYKFYHIDKYLSVYRNHKENETNKKKNCIFVN